MTPASSASQTSRFGWRGVSCVLGAVIAVAWAAWLSLPLWAVVLIGAATLLLGLTLGGWSSRWRRNSAASEWPQQHAQASSFNSALEANALLNRGMSEEEQESLRYAISHDLRAPLRTVDAFTRAVKDEYAHVLDAQAHQHLDRVLTAADRMNDMIDALLAQVHMASVPVQRQAVDVTALVYEVARDQWGVNRGVTNAALRVDAGMTVQADAAMLRRIFENLLGNALKYSAKVGQPQVSVGAMAHTSPQVFYVRDNGVGFDMKQADKLFGMFQRLHSAKDFPGTGVGLAVVRQIVQRHGGRIWAEAEVGKGACFYFTLDASQFQQRRIDR